VGLFADYTVRVVGAGAMVLGATAGALGSFAVLRRQSLIGDGLSHAALPGIALAFLLTGSKAGPVLLLGAAVAGWLGTLCVRAVVARSRIPFDSALGIMLSVFFGFGLVLLTLVQRRGDAAQAGLETFLFGQAATLLRDDVILMSVLGGLALATLLLGWRRFKVLAFDPDFGGSLGLPMRGVDALLTLLLVVAIVIGLQTVGVVLMSAMLVAPAAAARQWVRSLGAMVTLAALLGALAGLAGALASSATPGLPTGPTIVLALSVVVVVSLGLAPERGLLWRRLRLGAKRRLPRLDPVLMHLYALSLHHAEDPEHGHSIQTLRTMSPSSVDLPATLRALEARSLARQTADGQWAPTALGRREARRLLERQGAGER
jgi:manganese/zinc/iron transport system permease protein